LLLCCLYRTADIDSCLQKMATKPNVLVLGGLGFIGRNFVEYLVTNNLANRIRVADKVLPELAALSKKTIGNHQE